METFSMSLVGRKILKLILKKLYGRVLTGFIWLVMGTGCCEQDIDALGSIKWRELNSWKNPLS
jgi:hypothetical protein